jgi:hypothetical protein
MAPSIYHREANKRDRKINRLLQITLTVTFSNINFEKKNTTF